MRQRSLLPAVACLLAAACAGTTPTLGHPPERGLSSVLIGGRVTLPTGETRDAMTWINLEGEGDHANGEVYRLAVKPGEPRLYQVEPDSYHLAPTRNVFGGQQDQLTVSVEGRTYHAPFPRGIERKAVVVVKPSKIMALGIMEVRLERALPGKSAGVKVWLYDSTAARRKLLEDTIHSMMDPDAPSAYRNNAIQWTQALDQSLVELTEEPARTPLYKSGTP